MNEEIKNKTFYNILLVAGNGRNVGKTFVARQIIKKLSKRYPVTAVKISAHFHPLSDDVDIVEKNKDFIVVSETKITTKDSSLLWQAGAGKVYFVMADKPKLKQAFLYLLPKLITGPVVIESGGLHEIIQPGLLLYINDINKPVKKNAELLKNAIAIENDGQNVPVQINKIIFENGRFTFNN